MRVDLPNVVGFAILRRLLFDLDRQRAELRFLLPKHHLTACFINRLSPEILLLIFTEAQIASGVYDVSNLSSGPWTLGLVCRQWQHLVLTSGALWCRPLIKLDAGVKPQQLSHRLRISLTRSRHADLHIYVYETLSSLRHPDPCALTEVLHLLIIHSCRWRSAIFANLWTHSHIGLLNQISAMPRLETLLIYRFGLADPVLNPMNSINAFFHAPRLRYVRLYGFAHGHNISIRLPWNQLESFDQGLNWFPSFSTKELRSISGLSVLRLSHHLHSLQLFDSWGPSTQTVDDKT